MVGGLLVRHLLLLRKATILSTSEVEITFVVTKEGSISLGAEGEFANEVTNKLLLVLKPG
jgi:hypothetical protein